MLQTGRHRAGGYPAVGGPTFAVLIDALHPEHDGARAVIPHPEGHQHDSGHAPRPRACQPAGRDTHRHHSQREGHQVATHAQTGHGMQEVGDQEDRRKTVRPQQVPAALPPRHVKQPECPSQPRRAQEPPYDTIHPGRAGTVPDGPQKQPGDDLLHEQLQMAAYHTDQRGSVQRRHRMALPPIHGRIGPQPQG